MAECLKGVIAGCGSHGLLDNMGSKIEEGLLILHEHGNIALLIMNEDVFLFIVGAVDSKHKLLKVESFPSWHQRYFNFN